MLKGRAFTSSDYSPGAPFGLMVSRSFAEGAWPGLDPLQECVTLPHGAVELEDPEPCRPVIGVYDDLIVRSLADEGSWSVTWPVIGCPHSPARSDTCTASRCRRALMRCEDLGESGRPSSRFSAFLHSWLRHSDRTASWRSPSRDGVERSASARRSGPAPRPRVDGGHERGASDRRRPSHGVALADLAGRFIEALLFGVPAANPGVFALVAGVLIAAGLLAAWIPAWNATSIDPVRAMAVE